ncbi:MAG: Mrp/NBP35 family ATP-binding protein [Bacteroidales bacterium]|jgi:ATP-binding protein involved in chromosome partitioning|nr:Mrp/NBP35 family ATP-binding protein [Bacteroidales bacterium]
MIPKDQILSALKKVIHPEKGKDIVALGMVSDISSGENGISLILEPEKSNDPFIPSLKSSIAKTLKDTFGTDTVISQIEIRPKTIAGKQQKPVSEFFPDIKNIIAVSSGKGGVGKSTVAVNLAISLAKKNYRTGLLDADVFGPSVPIMFDAEEYKPEVYRFNGKDLIVPLEKYGVRILSTGFFVKPSDAVIWRGPMASGFLKQLMDQGDWGSLDFLIIDLPPGTSDIHLTMVQEVAVTGVIIVTTPQNVALADAAKGISMFRNDRINVPVLGIVENMSWFTPAELPENKYYIFGKEGGKKLAESMDVPLLGQIPLVQGICNSGDKGHPVALDDSPVGNSFMALADELILKVEKRNKELKPTVKVQMNK